MEWKYVTETRAPNSVINDALPTPYVCIVIKRRLYTIPLNTSSNFCFECEVIKPKGISHSGDNLFSGSCIIQFLASLKKHSSKKVICKLLENHSQLPTTYYPMQHGTAISCMN